MVLPCTNLSHTELCGELGMTGNKSGRAVCGYDENNSAYIDLYPVKPAEMLCN